MNNFRKPYKAGGHFTQRMSFEDFSIHFRMSMYSVSDLEPEVDCQTVYWIIQSVMSPVFILQLLYESVQGF